MYRNIEWLLLTPIPQIPGAGLSPGEVGEPVILPGLTHSSGSFKSTTWTQLEQTRFRLKGKFSIAPNIKPAIFECLLLLALKSEGIDHAEEPAFAFAGEERLKKLSDKASVRFGVSTSSSTKLESSL